MLGVRGYFSMNSYDILLASIMFYYLLKLINTGDEKYWIVIGIVYGLLKSNQIINPEIDKRNQCKCEPKKKKVKISKTRRYQSYDDKASISRRQNNKEERGNEVPSLKLQ